MFTQRKSMAEKAADEQEKLRMKRIKLASMQTDTQIRGEIERRRSYEIARLRS
jgi:hypothetical protein